MRFLIDEDLPRSLSGILHQFEHEAVDVRDISLRGANDSEIASYARKNELCLLTGDFGFADIRNYPVIRKSNITKFFYFPGMICSHFNNSHFSTGINFQES